MHCRLQLGELNTRYGEIQDLDAEVLAISTDDLSKAKLFADRLGLPFPVLYDPAAEVVRAYDVFNLLGDGLATPSTFIYHRQGRDDPVEIRGPRHQRQSVGHADPEAAETASGLVLR